MQKEMILITRYWRKLISFPGDLVRDHRSLLLVSRNKPSSPQLEISASITWYIDPHDGFCKKKMYLGQLREGVGIPGSVADEAN